MASMCDLTNLSETYWIEGQAPAVYCDGRDCTDNEPVRLEEPVGGGVYRIDMVEHRALRLRVQIDDPVEYAFHLANERSTDGWSGDAG